MSKTMRPPKPSSSSRSLPSAVAASAAAVAASEQQQQQQQQRIGPSFGPPMRDLSSSSVHSRDSLRHDVQLRKNSLTVSEQEFLQRLLIHGDEIEVQTAHETLMDTDLFFDRDSDNSNTLFLQQQQQDESERGWTLDQGISVGKELESSLTTSGGSSNSRQPQSHHHMPPSATASDPGEIVARPPVLTQSNRAASDALGSEKRRQHLQNRRNSIMFGRVWKSHANGLAVSEKSSRKSIQVRRNSLSSSMTSSLNSSSGQQQQRLELLYTRPETQAIFRGDYSKASATAVLMDDNKTDNNRNNLHHNGGSGNRRHSFSILRPTNNNNNNNSGNNISSMSNNSSAGRGRSSPRSQRSSSLRAAIPKPTFRRMMSEGSRKSVTFKDIPEPAMRPERIVSDGAVAAPAATNSSNIPPMIPPRRSFARSDSINSQSSIPSIHHAHPIRSPSAASSCAAAAAAAAATVQRSLSASSFPSLHMAHHVHSSDARSSVTSWTPSMDDTNNSRNNNNNNNATTTSNSILDHVGVVEYDPSSSREEKKTDPAVPAWSAPVPTNVELMIHPTKQQQQQQQVATTTATATKEQTTDDDDEDDDQRIRDAATKLLSHDQELPTRPVLMRRASRNTYNGEGIEVADYDAALVGQQHASFTKDSVEASRQLESLASFGADEASSCWGDGDDQPSYLRTPFSFDETMSFDRLTTIFRRKIERSLSDDNMNGIFLGGSRLLMRETSSLKDVNPGPGEESDDDSWGLDDEPSLNYYDAWKVIEDEYVNGYGGGNSLGFKILGTSASDEDCHPHVCSPPLLDSLLPFLPVSVSGNNYWMKYSAIRDGFSLYTLLMHARGAKHAVLAIETVDGEVFGCFTVEPWRKNWNWFGGGESFLWRMRGSRQEMHHSIIDQAKMESELDIFPYTGHDQCIQLCTSRIAVGGGIGDFGTVPVDSADSQDTGGAINDEPGASPASSSDRPPLVKDHEWGFGLALESDLLYGTSSPSATFGSPSLSRVHANGSKFEITNIELWTLTPCSRLEDAEKLELGLLFLKQNTDAVTRTS